MSELTKLIETKIVDSDDFCKVLRDVAIAFKTKGFFDNSNWCEKLVKPFKDLEDSEKEILNSFVDEPSKFEDSNDSFEIPETQVFPPTDHQDDELDSEGFVAMPDEEIEENDYSQSQALLQGIDLERNLQEFEDSDTIDLEISKLEWDDSTKNNDKDNDDTDSVAVTPDLDFGAFSTSDANVITELHSPKQSKVTSEISSLERNESPNECDPAAETQLFICDESTVAETTETKDKDVECVKDDDGVAAKIDPRKESVSAIAEKEQVDDIAEKEPADDNSMFKKPNLVTTNSNRCIAETAETQLFTKPTSPVAETTESNHVTADKIDDGNVDFDETQVFVVKSNSWNADISNESDDAYDVATQIIDVPKNASPKKTPISSSKNEEENGDISNAIDDAYDVATQVIVVPKNASPKRTHVASNEEKNEDGYSKDKIQANVTQKPKLRSNRILDSSDDEEEVDENRSADTLNDCVFDNAIQTSVIPKYVDVRTNRSDSPTRNIFSDLKGADWTQLCEQANNEQSKIPFKTLFETAIRQSATSKNKVNISGSTDGEENTSKRQKRSTSPIAFKVPNDSSNISSISSTSDEVNDNIAITATQPFVKASSTPMEGRKSVKVLTRRQLRSVTMPESRILDVVKKPIVKRLATKNQSLSYSPKPSDVQLKPEVNHATKVPEVNHATKVPKVSSDVNENVTTKPNQSDKVESASVATNRSLRKRKATTDTLSLSDESIAETSNTSPSMNRSSRIHNCRVMFTMIDPEPHIATLKQLNISLATTGEYNVLITNKIYRTTKFMCALAMGKPIVSMRWLDELKRKKSMIEPFDFLLSDKTGEEKYKFSLAKTLGDVQKNGGLLQNHSVLVTPNTTPAPDILKDIITSSGGKYLKTSLQPRKNNNILCISDEKDKKLVSQLKKKYATLKEITVEELMQCIFKYKI